jgi:transcription-repair coupling factor (superfamily II helicase)
VTPRTHRVVEGLLSTPVLSSLASSPPAPGTRTRITGNHGSAGTALVAALAHALPGRLLVVVTEGPEPAARAEADLVSLLGDGAAPLFPQGEARFYGEESDPRIGGLRVEAVEALFSGNARVFVTTPRGLQERVELPDRLARLRLELSVDEEIGFQLLVEELEALGYARAPLVEEVGQFAVRGGIVDVFSLGAADPVRLEFWGDTITSIRRFAVADQRSTGSEDRVHLLPASFRAGGEGEGGRTPRSSSRSCPTTRYSSTSPQRPGRKPSSAISTRPCASASTGTTGGNGSPRWRPSSSRWRTRSRRCAATPSSRSWMRGEAT